VWHVKLNATFKQFGLEPSEADPNMFVGKTEHGMIYACVWVDDILFAGKIEGLKAVKQKIMSTFDARDLGEAKLFVGFEITRDREAGTLKITQRRMASQLASQYGVSNAAPKAVPMATGVKLGADEGELLDTTKFNYSGLIGSLLYLSTCSRPDISHSVGVLARHMSKPTVAHWQAAMGVLKYVASTTDFGIQYSRGSSSEVVGFSDADYGGDSDTRKSTTGYVFMLNGGAVSWSSKLQPTVAHSTMEAEYMAASSATKEALWLRKLMSDFGEQSSGLLLHCDNQASLNQLKFPASSAESKHIDIMHHFARERIARKEVLFMYCSTNEMIADVMTKSLPEVKFVTFRSMMGMKA